MTKLEKDRRIADSSLHEFLYGKKMKTQVNVCTARPNWDSCQFMDLYSHRAVQPDGRFFCWNQSKDWCCIKVRLEKL